MKNKDFRKKKFLISYVIERDVYDITCNKVRKTILVSAHITFVLPNLI